MPEIYIDSDHMVGLAHTRLAIIDPSSGGHQPMRSADGRVTISFNGEIYNYPQLRDELSAQGHLFKGASDTEVLLAGYIAYGTKILDQLNGIFAFAIHDARNGQLFIARDHLGVKPLYFSETRSGFVFASEIKALFDLAPIDLTLDLSAIRRYLTFLWCPGEQTPLKHVKKLAPGSAMIIRNGEIARRWTYWQPPQYAPRNNWTAADCAAELDELIGTCVRRQMISDAPLGAFLSGGVDSSSIVAAARRWNPDIKCFTIELADGPEAGTTDDLHFARVAAAELGVSAGVRSEFDAHMMCDRAARMIEILDEPLADPACLNLLFISELARVQEIKVLLSGTGGDDLFAGYRRHWPFHSIRCGLRYRHWSAAGSPRLHPAPTTGAAGSGVWQSCLKWLPRMATGASHHASPGLPLGKSTVSCRRTSWLASRTRTSRLRSLS